MAGSFGGVGSRGPPPRHLCAGGGQRVHSNGGEASLPRVVDGHLRAAGRRFQQQAGALDVALSRAPAGFDRLP